MKLIISFLSDKLLTEKMYSGNCFFLVWIILSYVWK